MIQQVVTVTTAMMASKDRSAEEYMRDKLNALRARLKNTKQVCNAIGGRRAKAVSSVWYAFATSSIKSFNKHALSMFLGFCLTFD
jgi:hypothetical protein